MAEIAVWVGLPSFWRLNRRPIASPSPVSSGCAYSLAPEKYLFLNRANV